MFLGLLRVIFLQMVPPRQPVDLLNYYGVVSKRPLGFKLGVPFFFCFLFVFSLFMF